MKQNWEKEIEYLHKLDKDSLGKAVFYLVHQAKQEERDKILKELPKKKNTIEYEVKEWSKYIGFNDCLKQIKDIIKKDLTI